jgi:hypothetical protein
VVEGCELVGLEGCSRRCGKEGGRGRGRWDLGLRAELIWCLEGSNSKFEWGHE